MNKRFSKWEYPEIKDGQPTKYNWLVQNLDGFVLGTDTDIGSFSYINALNGVVIEDNVLIAAGSLVTPGKTLKSGYLYRGSPAKQIRELTEEELSFFTYSAKHYILLKNQHISELSANK